MCNAIAFAEVGIKIALTHKAAVHSRMSVPARYHLSSRLRKESSFNKDYGTSGLFLDGAYHDRIPMSSRATPWKGC